MPGGAVLRYTIPMRGDRCTTMFSGFTSLKSIQVSLMTNTPRQSPRRCFRQP